MLIVEKMNDDYFSIKSNYHKDYVDKLHKIPKAHYNNDYKKWIIPIEYFIDFEFEFYGEIIYKTPRWIFTGEPMPDYTDMYKIDENVQIPSLKIKPYNYQEYGIKFMIDRLKQNKFVINADVVGLGKTLQAIGSAKYFIENKGYKKILIIAKKALKKQWMNEINKFTDIGSNLQIYLAEKTPKKRKKIYDEISGFNKGILIINYHLVMNDYETLKDLGFDLVIIDECHLLRNRNGEQNKAITNVCEKAKKIIFLTGTPVTTRPQDIYGIVKIADKKYFGPWTKFEERYVKNQWTGKYNKFIGVLNLEELRGKVQSYLIRRTEHEVSIELPTIIDRRIDIDFDNTQLEILSAVEEEKLKISGSIKSMEEKLTKLTDPNEITKLKFIISNMEKSLKGLISCDQAIADDPRLFLMSKSQKFVDMFGSLIPKSYTMSPKNEALIDLVEEILEADEKVIIFSQFDRACKLIKSDLEKELGVKVLTYTGDDDEASREHIVDLFTNSADNNVFVATSAAEEGLNLQCASYIINYDQPFSPSAKTQRVGRIRRVGSKFTHAYQYDLITLGSCDERRLEELEKARGVQTGIYELNMAQSVSIKKAIGG